MSAIGGMSVRVRYFAAAKAALGRGSDELDGWPTWALSRGARRLPSSAADVLARCSYLVDGVRPRPGHAAAPRVPRSTSCRRSPAADPSRRCAGARPGAGDVVPVGRAARRDGTGDADDLRIEPPTDQRQPTMPPSKESEAIPTAAARSAAIREVTEAQCSTSGPAGSSAGSKRDIGSRTAPGMATERSSSSSRRSTTVGGVGLGAAPQLVGGHRAGHGEHRSHRRHRAGQRQLAPRAVQPVVHHDPANSGSPMPLGS